MSKFDASRHQIHSSLEWGLHVTFPVGVNVSLVRDIHVCSVLNGKSSLCSICGVFSLFPASSMVMGMVCVFFFGIFVHALRFQQGSWYIPSVCWRHIKTYEKRVTVPYRTKSKWSSYFAHSGGRVCHTWVLRHLSVCLSVHPGLVTGIQLTIFDRSCSYLVHPLTLAGAWTILILGPLFSFLWSCGTLVGA